MTALFWNLLSALGVAVVSILLLALVGFVLIVVAAIIKTFVTIYRKGKEKGTELPSVVTEIKEPGVYVATKDGLVKIKEGDE